ncbi:MAG: hypothetical protein MZU79_05795 [Anaerotruncus sp.]|nr:hypothetical protein [Anaerotruncus sp.]
MDSLLKSEGALSDRTPIVTIRNKSRLVLPGEDGLPEHFQRHHPRPVGLPRDRVHGAARPRRTEQRGLRPAGAGASRNREDPLPPVGDGVREARGTGDRLRAPGRSWTSSSPRRNTRSRFGRAGPRSADEIHLIQARHPLIDPKTVVANTIKQLGSYKAIIITGPNTGGKTKPASRRWDLLALMAQSGLLIPCMEHTKLPVFSGIYADIGDEQSIEQSLSTLSSHITKIIDILDKADAERR